MYEPGKSQAGERARQEKTRGGELPVKARLATLKMFTTGEKEGLNGANRSLSNGQKNC